MVAQAGAEELLYHDWGRNQSHHIVPLIRKLRHLTVGQLWTFLLDLTADLVPCNMATFYRRICDISVGKLQVPGSGRDAGRAHAEEEVRPPADSPVKSAPEPCAPEPDTVFPVDTLRSGVPEGVDPRKKEDYLSNADFQLHLGMTRADFSGLAKWKQEQAKKRAGLF